MKTYAVDVVLADRFTVEAESKPDAVAEAVRRALDMPACMCVEWTVTEVEAGENAEEK
jgi:hypothetical protein